MKPVQGRVTVAYPADVDVARAAELLERALQSSSQKRFGNDDAGGGCDDSGDGAHHHHHRHAVSISHVSKASITLDFLVESHRLDGANGTVDTTLADHHYLTSEEVAARLSAVPALRTELSTCVAALVPPHRETRFAFQRIGGGSTEGHGAEGGGGRLVQPSEFATVCASGLLRLVDDALYAAVRDVLRDGDEDSTTPASAAAGHQSLQRPPLPQAATHRALWEAFERHCERLVYSCGKATTTTVVSPLPTSCSALSRGRECSASPLPRIGGVHHQQQQEHNNSGEQQEQLLSMPSVVPPLPHSTAVGTQTSIDQPTNAAADASQLRQLTADMACLREELQCVESANRELEHDLHNACIARNEAIDAARQRNERTASLVEALDRLEVECSTWRTRAQEATEALMMPLTTVQPLDHQGHADVEGNVAAAVTGGGGDDGLRLQDLSEGEQLLTRLLGIREAQVGKLNTQLIASRKETVELRKKLANASCSQSRSSSFNGASQSRSSSAEVTTSTDAVDSDLTAGRRVAPTSTSSSSWSGGVDMVPRAAVCALEKRCEAAERELRERTMQMAQLLNVTQRSK